MEIPYVGLSIGQVMGLSSCIVIFVVAASLILHPSYDDGFLGKIALGGLIVSTMGPLWEHFHSGVRYNVLPTTLLIYVATALFLSRHAYRFQKYLKQGAFSWGAHKRRFAVTKPGTNKPDYTKMAKQIVWTSLVVAFLVYFITGCEANANTCTAGIIN